MKESIQNTKSLIQKLDQRIEDRGWTNFAIAMRDWMGVELRSQQQSLIQLKESEVKS